MKITKLGAKLFCFFLLVSLVPLGIVGTVVYKYVHDRTKDEVLRQLQSTAYNFNTQLNLLLSKKKSGVIAYSSDGFIRDCVEQMSLMSREYSHISEKLNNHLLINKKPLDPDIIEMEILNPEGKVIASTLQEQIGRDRSQEDYFKVPFISAEQKGSYFASAIERSETKNKLQLVFSGMLTDRILHRPLGVLVTKVKGDILQNLLNRHIYHSDNEGFIGPFGEIYIVDSNMLKIGDASKSMNIKQIVDTQIVKEVLASREEFYGIYENYKGVRVLGSGMFVPEANWVIVAERDVKDAFLPVERIRDMFVISGGGAIILVIMFAFIISGKISAIVEKLVEGTKRIADGDLEYSIKIGTRNDEIKELSKSFNLMTNKLRESGENNNKLLLTVKKGRDEWNKTFDAIKDIITIHNKDFKIIRANKVFFKKYNVKIKQFSGKKCYEIFHGTFEHWHNCPLVRSSTSLQPECEEVHNTNMGGTFLISTYPLLDDKGRFYGVVQQIKDITEDKKVREEIIKQKEYTENLIETAQDAIVCVEEKGIISVWNKVAEKIFGYSKSEIIGQPIKTIIPLKIMDWFLKKSRNETIGKTIEVSGKTKDGIIIPTEMSISCQKSGNGRYTFTIILRDTTSQIEAKMRLIRKSAELEKANKELETFVYILSHDLKEPMFAIEGFTSRLARDCKDSIGDKGKQYIGRVKVNIRRMSQKVSEVEEVFNIVRSKYNFEYNDSEAIVKDAVKTSEGRIRAENIKVEIQHNLPAVFCDKERLKDVFSNLVTNAIKFMGNSDRNHIKIGANKNNGYCKFFVEDTGIGIQEEYQEQIFEMFKRLKDIETEGTGVGLAIVKKIVEQHNGKIWIESPVKDGRGTRFCFTMPVTKQMR